MAGAALLSRKLSIVLQGRDIELLEQPQPGLSVLAGCLPLAHGLGRVSGTCSSQEHPLDSSCQNTKLSVCHLYQAVNSATV